MQNNTAQVSESINLIGKSKEHRYLTTFFAEKNLPLARWELVDNNGTVHHINNEVIIESLLNMHQSDLVVICANIRKLDFLNGDINHFLRYVAIGFINNVQG